MCILSCSRSVKTRGHLKTCLKVPYLICALLTSFTTAVTRGRCSVQSRSWGCYCSIINSMTIEAEVSDRGSNEYSSQGERIHGNAMTNSGGMDRKRLYQWQYSRIHVQISLERCFFLRGEQQSPHNGRSGCFISRLIFFSLSSLFFHMLFVFLSITFNVFL